MAVIRHFKTALMVLKNKGLRSIIELAWLRTTQMMPLRKTFVLECESDMDDNPRAFYEYLLSYSYNKKYRIVWLVSNVDYCKKVYKKHNVVFLNRHNQKFINQIKLVYYLNTSRWFIFSHPYWFYKKRKEQVVIHTGHGIPIKKGPRFFDHSCFDYVLVPSKNVSSWYTEFLWCDNSKVKLCGQFRNNLLFVDSQKRKQILSDLLNIADTSKVVICMPTFKQSEHMKDSQIFDPYVLSVVDSEEKLFQLNEIFKKDNVHLIIKIHPLQKMDMVRTTHLTNIHYLQNKELFHKNILLYELIGCCDALLTDFSSVAFDFLLLNRPVGFFLNNYNAYTRGYLLENPIDYMPGEKVFDYKGLLSFVHNLVQNKDCFEKSRMEICNYVNDPEMCDISNCHRFLEWLVNL